MGYELEKMDGFRWRIPRKGAMNTDGIIYCSDKMINQVRNDNSIGQVENVAKLPGIVGASMAMPDIHWGYGFPIGGVAAFDTENGVISPGGVGYDINCGVRLIRTGLKKKDIEGRMEELIGELYRAVPTGVGSENRDMKLSEKELKAVMERGAAWAVEKGFGSENDLVNCEENGRMGGADTGSVSERAIKRGLPQLGTLGSGNHFCEVDFVEDVYDQEAASAMGLEKDSVVVFVHCGSRGLGHQICDDYIRVMLDASRKYGIELPDRQLCCALFKSDEGQEYFSAMACAVNYAFANRQMITHMVREALERFMKAGKGSLETGLIYDVCHNIAKVETHDVKGKPKKLCVHRKGATRAFPPGHDSVPAAYRNIGQPVLIPGDMGRYSFVLTGTGKGFSETWGSCCHGAGRLMSREKAKNAARGRRLFDEMDTAGVFAMAHTKETMAEEMPEAYKDVSDVVDAVHGAGIAKKTAKLRPLGVIKG